MCCTQNRRSPLPTRKLTHACKRTWLSGMKRIHQNPRRGKVAHGCLLYLLYLLLVYSLCGAAPIEEDLAQSNTTCTHCLNTLLNLSGLCYLLCSTCATCLLLVYLLCGAALKAIAAPKRPTTLPDKADQQGSRTSLGRTKAPASKLNEKLDMKSLIN